MYLNATQLISIICYSVFSNLLFEVLIMFLHENHSRVKFTMCEVSLSDASPKMMSYCSVLFFGNVENIRLLNYLFVLHTRDVLHFNSKNCSVCTW